jgi:serine/threonine-protein kinase
VSDLTHLGKYEIKSALGKGAMGIVYKGYDPTIERFVAIKTIRKDLVDPEVAKQYMARFKNEARAAGRLTHPQHRRRVRVRRGRHGRVHRDGVSSKGAGCASTSTAANVRLRAARAALRQLLEALEFAHGRGVVHRDIKPSNLIVSEDGSSRSPTSASRASTRRTLRRPA